MRKHEATWGEEASETHFSAKQKCVVHVITFDQQALDNLTTWTNKYLGDYDQEIWSSNISKRLPQLQQLLDIPQILSKIPSQCQQLILIPHLFLHLLPIHAIPLAIKDSPRKLVYDLRPYQPSSENSTSAPLAPQSRGETGVQSPPNLGDLGGLQKSTPEIKDRWQPCLQDYFANGISYAPSCQLLQRIQRQKERGASLSKSLLFAIQNPTEDLEYADLEVNFIQQGFDPQKVLIHQQANKANFTDTETLEFLSHCYFAHFACHGGFNGASPLDSALALAESLTSSSSKRERDLNLRDGRSADINQCLTLKEIFTTLELPEAYLVILSACETNLSKIGSFADEYISLTTGFIYAGAANIVGSLWRVDDLATASLMIRFYQNLFNPQTNLSINQALQQAQNWLRTITKEKFLKWIKTINIDKQTQDNIDVRLNWDDDDNILFSEPQYWAGFTAVVQNN